MQVETIKNIQKSNGRYSSWLRQAQQRKKPSDVTKNNSFVEGYSKVEHSKTHSSFKERVRHLSFTSY